jgi:hypothetical protein
MTNNKFWYLSFLLKHSSQRKERRESVHHWKSGHYVFLKPEQEFQLRGLYETDNETKMHWERAKDNAAHATFGILDMDFTMPSNGSESENKDVKSLDTKAERQQGKSNLELAMTVNNALKEYLDKADMRMTQAKKNLPKNLPILQKSMTLHQQSQLL